MQMTGTTHKTLFPVYIEIISDMFSESLINNLRIDVFPIIGLKIR